MGRKKAKNREELFSYHIQAKVSEKVYQRLNQILNKSDCQTIAELVRRILSKQKITCYYKDASLDAPIQELIRIRKELNAIGVNINQITHHFHTADVADQKFFNALRIAEEYRKVGEKIDVLQIIVLEITRKWLRK